ncbi:hypothetical protein GOB05_30125 [Sinorhizobium meliloti]|nr:hypothetical protein [Sinorhizobium meliloti]
MLGVLAGIVEHADRLAGRLSCRLQLCFQVLQLGLSRNDPSYLEFLFEELTDEDGKIAIEFLRERQKPGAGKDPPTSLASTHGVEYLDEALKAFQDKCEAALKVARQMNPQFGETIMTRLL